MQGRTSQDQDWGSLDSLKQNIWQQIIFCRTKQRFLFLHEMKSLGSFVQCSLIRFLLSIGQPLILDQHVNCLIFFPCVSTNRYSWDWDNYTFLLLYLYYCNSFPSFQNTTWPNCLVSSIVMWCTFKTLHDHDLWFVHIYICWNHVQHASAVS